MSTSAKTLISAEALSAAATRLKSIDALRGIVMIIMALDHVRDFVHSAAGQFAPENLALTTPALFFTRWITHFCAPVFMFLAGTSAFLWAQRNGNSTSKLSHFLLTRGLWLIFIELTLMQFALFFNFSYRPVILSVIWALGCSMVALSGLVYLPVRVLAAVSIAMIALHNLLDGFQAASFGRAAWIWTVLHQSSPVRIGGRIVIFGYPLIPWIAVMAAGFCFGPVFLMENTSRRRILFRLGTALTGAFLILRFVNVYGDPRPWSTQDSLMFTVLSFLNCTKYPPSLLFLLMTLGPALLVLCRLDRMQFSSKNPAIVLGRVPLFFFALHFFAIHLLAALLMWLTYGSTTLLFNPPPSTGGPRPASGYGFDLWFTYLFWLAIVALLYPACLWFANLKRRRKDWWLSYC
jgi:uncharacterized membrane protein